MLHTEINESPMMNPTSVMKNLSFSAVIDYSFHEKIYLHTDFFFHLCIENRFKIKNALQSSNWQNLITVDPLQQDRSNLSSLRFLPTTHADTKEGNFSDESVLLLTDRVSHIQTLSEQVLSSGKVGYLLSKSYLDEGKVGTLT